MGTLPPPARSQLLSYGVRPPRFVADLRPSLHLQQTKRAIANSANSASATKLVIKSIGDSNGTEAANDPLTYGANLYSMLLRALRRANPGVTITNGGSTPGSQANYLDRSIGGSTWSELASNTSRSGIPSWYTVPGQPWLSTYVGVNAGIASLAPDLLWTEMGVNSAQGTSISNIRSVLNTISTGSTQFPTTPDLLVFTNPGVTLNAPGTFTQAFVDGCMQGAALVRSVVRANARGLGLTQSMMPTTPGLRPIGMVDLNRYDAMMRLGVDPCRQPLQRVVSGLTGITGAAWVGKRSYTMPQCYGDFHLRVRFPAQASSLFASGRTLFVDVSPAMQNGSVPATFYCGQNATLIASNYNNGYFVETLANATLGSGDVLVEIWARQEWVRIQINGTTVLDGLMCRAGWVFQPRIYFNADADTVVMDVEQYDAGSPLRIAPTIPDRDMWGDIGGVYGGNALNHPSEMGLAEGVQTILDQVDLCCL